MSPVISVIAVYEMRGEGLMHSVIYSLFIFYST